MSQQNLFERLCGLLFERFDTRNGVGSFHGLYFGTFLSKIPSESLHIMFGI